MIHQCFCPFFCKINTVNFSAFKCICQLLGVHYNLPQASKHALQARKLACLIHSPDGGELLSFPPFPKDDGMIVIQTH